MIALQKKPLSQLLRATLAEMISAFIHALISVGAKAPARGGFHSIGR
jgi:hypothetical protein